jgi:hypothetical protein
VLLIKGSLVFLGEGFSLFGEDGHGWIFAIEILDRVTDRLDTSVNFLGNVPNDFGQICTLGSESAGTIDDVIALCIRHLTETLSSLDADFVEVYEAFDTGMKKPNAFSPFGNKPPRYKPLISPTGNRLGRHVEKLAQILDGVNRFGSFFETKIHRIGDILDEQSQVMLRIVPLDQAHAARLGTNFSDAIEEEVEWIFLRPIEFREKLLGAVGLFKSFASGSKSNLLVSQFSDQCNLVFTIHLLLASCHANNALGRT